MAVWGPLVLMMIACPSVEPELELVGLTVAPGQIEASVGEVIQLTAQGLWSDDTTSDLTTTVDWITADPEEAEVDAGGRVTLVDEGQATVTATLDLLAASTLITIGPAELVQLIPTPLSLALAAGEQAPITITGRFGDGALADLTDDVTWSSTDSGVATADSAVVTAGSAGEVDLIATLGEVSVAVPIDVVPAELIAIVITPDSPELPLGSSVAFAATGIRSDGSEADVTAVAAWSSSDVQHLAVDGASGEAFASGLGGAIVEAELSGVIGSTVALVVAADLVELAIEQVGIDLPLGGSYGFTALATASDGSETDVTAVVTWSSDNPFVAVASNDAGMQGVVSSTGQGTVTLRASLGDLEALTVVTVGPAALLSLAIDPPVWTTPLGVSVDFAAIGTYTDGSELDHTSDAAWSADLPLVAVFGGGGTAVPAGQGTTDVTASFGDLDAGASLTVEPAALVSIAVTPPSVEMAVGELLAFEATGTYTTGAVTDVTESVFWASSAPGFVTVNNLTGDQGEATAVAEGIATVLASLTSLSGAAVVEVISAAPVSLGILPLLPVVTVGSSLPLTAGALLTDGTLLDVTSEVTWASLDPGLATLTNDLGSEGLLTGLAAGSAEVTATLGPIVGFAVVEVEDP
jgi:hypothetical protein